jgi:hypothetical protein
MTRGLLVVKGGAKRVVHEGLLFSRLQILEETGIVPHQCAN